MSARCPKCGESYQTDGCKCWGEDTTIIHPIQTAFPTVAALDATDRHERELWCKEYLQTIRMFEKHQLPSEKAAEWAGRAVRQYREFFKEES